MPGCRVCISGLVTRWKTRSKSSEPDAARSRARRCAKSRCSCTRSAKKSTRASGSAIRSAFSEVALGCGVGDADRLLRPAVAAVERPAGGAVRPGRAQVLHLRPGAVAAGLHLPDGDADHRGASLFLFTVVAGRLWCGYTCPQTVYTEIFMWIERQIEGDRGATHEARQGADVGAQAGAARAPSTPRGSRSRCGPASPSSATSRRSAGSRSTSQPSPSAAGRLFWILFYGFATYGNAGWLREQVCIYMCPYARFQSAMFDKDTLIVSYDRAAANRAVPAARNRPRRTEPGRLRRLQAVRAGVPDRHRHPRRPAIRMHRLRRLHRCLRRRDGQGRPCRRA